MSRSCYKLTAFLLAGILLALCLSGCEKDPQGIWLCSIKKDGSGFKKILKNDFEFSDWEYINYMMRVYPGNNGKLVLIYSDGLKVYDLNTKDLTTIFTDKMGWYCVWSQAYYMKKYGNITFSADGNKAYYTVDGDLKELDLETCHVTSLYTGPYYVSYPIIDDTHTKIILRGEIGTPVPQAVLVTYHLDTQTNEVINGVQAYKACFSNSLQKYFYTMTNSIYAINSDGSGTECIFMGQDTTTTNNDPYVFDPFSDGDKIVTTDHYWNGNLVILDCSNSSTQIIGNYVKQYAYPDLATQTVSIDRADQNVYFASEGKLQHFDVLDNSLETIMDLSDGNSPESYHWLNAGWDNDRVYFIGDFSQDSKEYPTKLTNQSDRQRNREFQGL